LGIYLGASALRREIAKKPLPWAAARLLRNFLPLPTETPIEDLQG
jgi:hypothetical protein